MPFRLFQYQLPADDDLADLNAFLTTHRIAAVQREIVTTAAGTMLLFIVEWVLSTQKSELKSANVRVDYREVLSDEEFAIFGKLREIRKGIADAEGVPVYAVFSNAQLASMVQEKCTSVAQIQQIEGIGRARADKYASSFLPALQRSCIAT